MNKNCKNCQQIFEITESDLGFYDKISPVFPANGTGTGKKFLFPEPSLCPDCRQQRRLAFRNERKLYKRKCDATGKEIISIYSADKPYKVFDQGEWWSDRWDGLDYGREFDFGKSFFAQFNELLLKVPRLSVFSRNSVNSDYTNYEEKDKNCYLCFAGGFSEDCMHCYSQIFCKNCVDCSLINHSELCYECLKLENCYQCFYVQNSQNCNNCYLGMDLIGCSNCFGCCGLRNKIYYIFNKAYSKEDYEKEIKNLLLKIKSKEILDKFEKLSLKISRKYAHILKSEDCSGDFILNSQNCDFCFDVSDGKDSKFMTNSDDFRDCYDCDHAQLPADLVYDSQSVCLGCYMNAFCNYCWTTNNSLYCDSCHYSKNLFGCVGLKHREYCVFNKQYTKEEYEQLVPKIIQHMIKIGEWGEFYPISISPFAYNETVAQEYFPLTKEEAFSKGYKWKDEDINEKPVYTKVDVPEFIGDVSDDIVREILTCESCGKNYKIIPQELKFYREMNLPIPRKCPDCRHKERIALRNPRKLWKRNCMKCGVGIETTYAPAREEIVYCEKCYLESLV